MDKVINILEKENIEHEWIELQYFAVLYIKIKDKDVIVLNNNLKNQREIKLNLIHELGHFFTGTIYTHKMSSLFIDKCEYKALKCATTFLMPKEKVAEVIKNGITEIWELAEYFDVPEEWLVFRLNLSDIEHLKRRYKDE